MGDRKLEALAPKVLKDTTKMDKLKDNDKHLFSKISGEAISDLRQSITNLNYGFSYLPKNYYYRPNVVDKGYVFFTRPMLSLHRENLLRISRLSSYLTTDKNSVHYYVKCLLDPRLCYKMSNGIGETGYEDIFQPEYLTEPPMLDNKNPFITLFTNTLKDLSGFPEPRGGFFVTEPNLGGGQTVIVDSHNFERGVFDIGASFDNPQGNTLTLLLELWRDAQALQWEGIIHPYPDHIFNELLNYKTAIYRFVLDQYKKTIVMCSKTIASLAQPDTAKLFDFSDDQTGVRNDTTINVNFKCEGVEYNNPYILVEFNKTLITGIPEFDKLLDADLLDPTSREDVFKSSSFNYELIPDVFKEYFNYRCYPYVNLNTGVLEWYADKNSPEYQKLIEKVK